MKSLPSFNIRENGRSIVLFLLGCLAGGILFLLLYAQKLDSLYLERDAIYYANNQKHKQILKLQQEIGELERKGRPSFETDKIKNISVEVSSEQRFGAETIKAQVESLLEPFIDKPMQWVSNNPELVESVLQKKPIPIDSNQQQQVQVHVKYISFYGSTLKIWITTEEISKNSTIDSKE
jgi:hypothetical protein